MHVQSKCMFALNLVRLDQMLTTIYFREVDAALKFLKEECGAKRIGVVGFCWGGVATHHLALQYPELKAGVSVYGTPF